MSDQLNPCWICGRETDEIDVDFEAWMHEKCSDTAWRQFFAAEVATVIAHGDGVAVLL